MAQQPTVSIAFKGIEPEDKASEAKLREVIDRRCEQLSNEFHEVSRIEISFEQDGLRYAAHAHVTGKGRDVGAQADASELLPAADRLLEKVERQLRTLHDKHIFTQRREAQRRPPKKRPA